METKKEAPTGQDRGNTERKDKCKVSATQLQTIFQHLYNNSATASMVTAATGVPQKCVTRYKRDLEKTGRLWEIEKTYCQRTGYRAWYLTTNPDKAPKCDLQLKLNLV
jgi:hypothetical protein